MFSAPCGFPTGSSFKKRKIVIDGDPADVEAAIVLVEAQISPWRGSGFPGV